MIYKYIKNMEYTKESMTKEIDELEKSTNSDYYNQIIFDTKKAMKVSTKEETKTFIESINLLQILNKKRIDQLNEERRFIVIMQIILNNPEAYS
jgi:hypothetical protein